MKKIIAYLSFLIMMFFAACSGKSTKVMVMASGKVTTQENTITLSPGTTHNEATFEPTGETITVNTSSGNKEFSVKEGGLYILNLKNDTIVGSFQPVGTDNSRKVITQEDLFNRVDSLNKLMAGQNVSEAAKNYNIPPMSIARITANTNAQIIGPYRKIPGSFDPSQQHEVYKFYTNKEVAEIVTNVKKMLSN